MTVNLTEVSKKPLGLSGTKREGSVQLSGEGDRGSRYNSLKRRMRVNTQNTSPLKGEVTSKGGRLQASGTRWLTC